MLIRGLPRPPDPNDLTLRQAEQAAQKDYARLLHLHSPSWSIDLFTGIVRWSCSCTSPGPRNAAAMDTHILTEIRRARGPAKR